MSRVAALAWGAALATVLSDELTVPRLEAVERWAMDAGVASQEAEAFEAVARRHPLPRDALVEFCHGQRGDLAGDWPITEADVNRYCYRVAGTVGVVMASLLGVVHADTRRQAAALGMAMQRTNILRDIAEDGAAGRRYLAREAIVRHGEPVPGRREPLLREQIERADAFYEEGIDGIRSLRRGRLAVALAACLYREILRQIEREGYGRARGRAVVPRSRKLAVLCRTVVGVGGWPP